MKMKRGKRDEGSAARGLGTDSDLRLTRKAEILAFLETDRIYAGYAVGDLEPGLFEQCEWYGSGRGQVRPRARRRHLAALALVFHGFKPSVLFLMGEPASLARILFDPALPSHIYLNCREEHLSVAGSRYSWDGLTPMWRMSLGSIVRRPSSADPVKLGPEDAQELVALYALGGGGAFDPAQMDHGVYYGVIAGGSIVAVAGTHLVSPTYRVAAIGNVFTHPDWRGRGFGSAATRAVAADLRRRGIRDVILNVSRANHTALGLYEGIGFRRYCAFFEGPAST